MWRRLGGAKRLLKQRGSLRGVFGRHWPIEIFQPIYLMLSSHSQNFVWVLKLAEFIDKNPHREKLIFSEVCLHLSIRLCCWRFNSQISVNHEFDSNPYHNPSLRAFFAKQSPACKQFYSRIMRLLRRERHPPRNDGRNLWFTEFNLFYQWKGLIKTRSDKKKLSEVFLYWIVANILIGFSE